MTERDDARQGRTGSGGWWRELLPNKPLQRTIGPGILVKERRLGPLAAERPCWADVVERGWYWNGGHVSWLDKVRQVLAPASQERSLAGHTVLVADASVTIQKVVSLALEDQGCNVIAVASGDAAIAELGGRHVDVVLAATKLPGRSGYEVCAWLKSRLESRATRVILLKEIGEPLDEQRRAEAGWDGVLNKPFLPQQLVSMVSRMASEATALGRERRGPTSG